MNQRKIRFSQSFDLILDRLYPIKQKRLAVPKVKGESFHGNTLVGAVSKDDSNIVIDYRRL